MKVMMNNATHKYRYTSSRFLIATTIVIGMTELLGCSPTITVGGYQHVDMSSSHYREQIRKKADELAESKQTKDKRLAAELYGSIKELELMDKCFVEYFDKEPEKGAYLLMRGEKIHKFYKSFK